MRTVYANALLSDGEILFWYTGDECKDWHDFYKDFYYAGLNMSEYETTHDLQLVKMGFIDPTEEWDYNEFIFDVLAKKFYKQYFISKDSRGSKPYEV